MKTLHLSDSYKRLGNQSKSLRTKECGTYLQFTMQDDDLKLHKANFCKVRLCPMCSWRRTLKIFSQTSKIMNAYCLNNPTDRFLFLTLTVKNCTAQDLSNQIDLLFQGFNKLFKYKAVNSVVKGYFRALEITYNCNADTFHPHFHIVLAVPDYYFKNSNYYLSQEKWVKLWIKAMKLDYLPQVDIRAIKNNEKGVKEISKYSVKDSDYLTKDDSLTDYLVEILDNSLHRRRLFSFGKEFKAIHKELNLDDVVDGDLTDNDELRDDVKKVIYKFRWNIGFKDYYLI